jgi:hypothetical protein
MFSGIQEILVLVIIVLGILFLPRIFNRSRTAPLGEAKPSVILSGRMRLGIAASFLWPAVIAAFMQPWEKDPFLYLYLGVGPVALIWIIYWVYIGFRQK